MNNTMNDDDNVQSGSNGIGIAGKSSRKRGMSTAFEMELLAEFREQNGKLQKALEERSKEFADYRTRMELALKATEDELVGKSKKEMSNEEMLLRMDNVALSTKADVYGLGVGLHEEIGKIRCKLHWVKGSVNELKMNGNSGGTSDGTTTAEDMGELDERIQQMIGQQMAPMQHEMDDLRNENASLKNGLERNNQALEKSRKKFQEYRIEMAQKMVEKDEIVGRANKEIACLKEQVGQLNKPKIYVAKLSNASSWSAAKSSNKLEISGLKAVSKEYNPGYYSMLFTNAPFDATAPRLLSSAGFNVLYYYEVEIVKMIESDDVCIGFVATAEYTTRYIEFDSKGGMKCRSSVEWKEYGNGFKKGDVVGCGLVVPPSPMNAGKSDRKPYGFLTINGVAMKNVPIGDVDVQKVWPVAGLGCEGSSLVANFGKNPGKPFKYNPWEY